MTRVSHPRASPARPEKVGAIQGPGVSNRQVVQELKEANRLGCVHLVELYQNRLLGEAVNVFHVPPADADEIVSDTLLAVVTEIQSFEFKRSDGDFHFWVMTILRNRIRDFVRHRALTEGLMTSFQEAALEEEELYSPAEREVVGSIVRQYEESLRTDDEAFAHDGGDTHRKTGRGSSRKLQVIADTLELMETWERVLLRCRALDVPYDEISTYTGKPVKQLKVYHARVKKKFIRLLAKYYPELAANTEIGHVAHSGRVEP